MDVFCHKRRSMVLELQRPNCTSKACTITAAYTPANGNVREACAQLATLQREQGLREWKVTARSGAPPRVKLCQLSSSQGATLSSITMLGRKRFMSMGSGTLLFKSLSDDCIPSQPVTLQGVVGPPDQRCADCGAFNLIL